MQLLLRLSFVFILVRSEMMAQTCPESNCSHAAGSAAVCGTRSDDVSTANATASNTSCRSFANLCELQQANCNRTLSSAWRQTVALQCRNFVLNATQPCACPALLTSSSCAANATPLCVRSSSNPGNCRLMQDACELSRARCFGEDWTTVDSVQCRGLSTNTTAACTCPNLQNCSTNRTDICVRSPQGCRLMRNECELERALCQGENLTRIDGVQCRGFSADGTARECACPMLENCENMSTLSPCVLGPNGCKLMANECELERALCMGETWSWSYEEHCINFRSTDAPKNCTCPNLANCSEAGSGLCVRSERGGCMLMRHVCDLERARCRGEVWTKSDAIQCLNFRQDEAKACACPKLQRCSSSGPGICVKGASGCKLMANECDLERARCSGEKWTKVDSVQCLGFQVGGTNQCTCPKLEKCTKTGSICVKGRSGCKLFMHACDLEHAKCAGKDWLPTDPVQCAHFATGEAKACACPCLRQCSSTAKVCAASIKGHTCKSFRSECALRRRICMGEEWTLTGAEKCKGIQLGASGECACPNMRGCSKRQRGGICMRDGNSCKSFKTDCDLKKALCRGEGKWRRTNAAHCCQFRLGEHRNCTLAASKAVCATINNRTCRQFRSECDLRNANKNADAGKPWHAVSRSSCKCFRPGQTKACARAPRCRPRDASSSSRNDTTGPVCGRHGQQRRIFKTHCDLLRLNYRLCADFKPARMKECLKSTKKLKRATCQSCNNELTL